MKNKLNTTQRNTNEINLDFSKQNLKTLLEELIQEKSIYSHEDFANWIYKYLIYCFDSFDNNREIETSIENVVNDIDAQWELNIVNTYSLDELENLDLSTIKFPIEMLEMWYKKLV